MDFVARFVEGAYGVEDARGVACAGRGQGLFEDGGERGAGVFDVGVNASTGERLLADIASGEVEAPSWESTDSISWARSSPRTTCSVKFFAPMTMRDERGGAQAVMVKRRLRIADAARFRVIFGLPLLCKYFRI
jgi:hypothetical protein